ncbi:MAG: radical SAM protein [Enhygromyxa sp.]
MRLTHRAVEALRREHGRSVSLFITDRCQVGCGHCSVDSRVDSPTITDFELFETILGWIAAQPELELVSITGGEPFVERRGLALATRRLGAAGKVVVVYTSGVWAASARGPGWLHDVLARCDCVYLSTDAYHAEAIDEATLINAAREIVAAEAWLVLQVLELEGAREQAAELLNQAFGGRWDQHAEINVVPPVRHGRAASLFLPGAALEGRSFGPCPLLRSPVIRYDGAISACSNDGVIVGFGPGRLRRQIRSAAELDHAIAALRADPALRVIDESGFGALTRHRELAELANQRFSVNCELCWKALGRLPEGSDPELDALTIPHDEEP